MRFAALFLALALTAFSADTNAPQAGGKWQLSVSAPAADGSRSISASLPADAPIPSGFAKVTPLLVLRYRSGRTSAFVVFDTFLGSGTLDARVAYGDQSPVDQKWEISSDGRSAFVPGDALEFIQRLKTVKTLAIRITPGKAAPVTVRFSPIDTELVVKALLSVALKG